ncbi:MAG: hypothetical protein L3J91_07350, partial [Thermoplasmata archaeon]|nr:hypothetical protein [Thermoplasmata archaeon]
MADTSGEASVADSATGREAGTTRDPATARDPATRRDPATAEATIVLRVHVQPGAGRSSVVGRYGSSL